MATPDRSLVRAWTFYDWANSAYTLTITSTVFPIYYEDVTRTATSDAVQLFGLSIKNAALYSFVLAFAYLIVAITSPILSGIADYTGHKKRFMQFYCNLGALSCALMYFFERDTLWIGLLTIIGASVGYCGSLVFYNAYLPEIAAPEDQDRVSAQGFAMGYIGSVILLLFNLSMLMQPAWYGGISGSMAARVAFITVGAWWWGFAQITFAALPAGTATKSGTGRVWLNGYRELRQVFAQLRQTPRLTRFLLAFFVYNMGVQSVMLMASLFGKKEVHLQTGQLIITILIIQLVAVGGAFLFSSLSRSYGNIRTLQIATLAWIGVCVAAYFVYTAQGFYAIAMAVGLVMGGIQALSRSTYSKLLPETADHASYFSFFDVCDRMGTVCGMAMFGAVTVYTDTLRQPILALLVFFVIGFLLLMRVPSLCKTQDLPAEGV
ncbi:MAG: MFS transporter [Candidatus Sericytochromatia bacterium]|nr:MFS transporter [Candidatus Sericytochromatia bacterium]